ncbi:MAG: hypothetical protein F8N39_07510 [Clostridiaceae bacterium]|nr:hypothetical protein [Clostridiaceae bacterium]
MKSKKTFSIILGAAIISSLFVGCNLRKNTIIPEDVVAKVVKASEKPKSYYGESKLDIYENGNLKESGIYKEWVDNSSSKIKRRSEIETKADGKVITTNDGDKITIYMEKDKKALTSKVSDDLSGLNSNYKDQFIKQLGIISKTHELTFKGEEIVKSMKTYHILAKPKEKNSLMGNQEFWIEEENWFVIKSSSESNNMRIDQEYTKLDFSPKLDNSLFVQKLSSDVKIENIDNSMALNKGTSSNLKDGAKMAGKPILYLPENKEYKLKSVTTNNFEKINHKEVEQTYEKNGAVSFILTTVISDDNSKKDDFNLPNEKEITIRGQKGTFMDDSIKVACWSENGLNYSILIQDPKLTLEETKKIAESLVFTN